MATASGQPSPSRSMCRAVPTAGRAAPRGQPAGVGFVATVVGSGAARRPRAGWRCAQPAVVSTAPRTSAAAAAHAVRPGRRPTVTAHRLGSGSRHRPREACPADLAEAGGEPCCVEQRGRGRGQLREAAQPELCGRLDPAVAPGEEADEQLPEVGHVGGQVGRGARAQRGSARTAPGGHRRRARGPPGAGDAPRRRGAARRRWRPRPPAGPPPRSDAGGPGRRASWLRPNGSAARWGRTPGRGARPPPPGRGCAARPAASPWHAAARDAGPRWRAVVPPRRARDRSPPLSAEGASGSTGRA